MSDPITRLNAALEGRYRIERELGEGGMARRVSGIYSTSFNKRASRPAAAVDAPQDARPDDETHGGPLQKGDNRCVPSHP